MTEFSEAMMVAVEDTGATRQAKMKFRDYRYGSSRSESAW
jgi:hypothetical protein